MTYILYEICRIELIRYTRFYNLNNLDFSNNAVEVL
jgi:hypothetical protein